MNRTVLVNGEQIDYSGLPEHIQGGMQRYMENSLLPGGFLRAVLENDLRRACEKADNINRHKLFDIVSWLYNNAPANSWGSVRNVQDWSDNGQQS